MQNNFEEGKQLQIWTTWFQNLPQHSEVLDTCIEQSPEIDSHIHGQRIFNNGAKVIQCGRKKTFSVIGAGLAG